MIPCWTRAGDTQGRVYFTAGPPGHRTGSGACPPARPIMEAAMHPDIIVLFEHPEWQKPLFSALERRGVRFGTLDLKRACFDPARVPEAPLYFNQASPSAYVRGNTRA